jgi:hypothetical protein
MKSDGLKYVIISDNPGKNYCGHRVRQTKIDVGYFYRINPQKISPSPTPNSMLVNETFKI